MGMDHPAFTMAGLCTVGGLMGYARKKSTPSLVAGLAIGALYGFSGYLLHNNANYGIELALGTSALLTGSQFPRAFKGKPLPIALSVVGIVNIVYFGKKYTEFM